MMTAPAIQPDAIDAALPDFDADVACEVRFADTDERCGAAAVWRVRAHGYLSSRDTHCATHTVLMCEPCLTFLRERVAEALADGPVLCSDCGRIVTQVSDSILSVVAL